VRAGFPFACIGGRRISITGEGGGEANASSFQRTAGAL